MVSSNNNINKLETPREYKESSIRFRELWVDYVDKKDKVDFEVVNMLSILESNGYSRTHAIEKIVEDHNDLKGFSRRTIYRELPDEMKQDNSLRDLKQYRNDDEQEVTNKPLDVPNDTYETINTTTKTLPTAYEVKDAEQVGEAVDQIYDLEQEEQSEQEPHVIYDQDYVKRLEQKIEEQQKEIEYLKQKYDFVYDLEVKDQILPEIVTCFPDKKTGYIRIDKRKLLSEKKR
jgi:hypothetical protein